MMCTTLHYGALHSYASTLNDTIHEYILYAHFSLRTFYLAVNSALQKVCITNLLIFLSQGYNVVIDDEHWSVTTRNSYAKTIKAKVRCTALIPHLLHIEPR